MNMKQINVFFLTLACIFLVASTVSAVEVASIDKIKIDDIYATGDEVAVEAGETITVKVFFESLQDASDVKVKLELEGQKVDAEAVTAPFNVESGYNYAKTLTLRVPYELQNEVSEDYTLDLKIWNNDFRTEDNSITLRVQRTSYNAAIMDISSQQTIEAGQVFPVDVVIKNKGYNNLDDLYITTKIAKLGIERKVYFGDLVSIEDRKYEDTEAKRIYLQIPYSADAGLYSLEVEASNSDLSASKTKQFTVENEFNSNTVVTSMTKSSAVNDDVEFEVIVANPTDKLRVFRIVTESNGDLTTSSSTELVAVPAGMTKTVIVTAHPHTKGEYDFDVSIFAGEELVDNVTLGVYASGSSSSGSVVALTIILAIIFLVLLGALIVMLRKKQDKSEEFGESYY